MPSSASAVQPLGWTIQPELPDTLRFIKVHMLPRPIYESLRSLQKTTDGVLPTTSLYDALAAHSSAIIAFHPNAFQPDNVDRRWLYTLPDATLNSSRLPYFLQIWLTACYGKERATSIIESWGACHWDESTLIDLQSADDDLKKMLLPGLIARWVKEQGFQPLLYKQDSKHRIPLHLVQLMTQRSQCELVSEPRLFGSTLGSFVLRFWLDTRPQTGELCLLHRLSVRRWITEPLVGENGFIRLPMYRNKSVYLRTAPRYLDNTPSTQVLSRIRLRMVGNPDEKVRWLGYQTDILNQLRLEPIPVPLALLTNPDAYTDRLLVTYNKDKVSNAGLGVGLYANDHRQLFQDLSTLLEPHFQSLPISNRITSGDRRAWNNKSLGQQAIPEKHLHKAWSALRHMAHPLHIELYVDDVETVKSKLLEIVGNPPTVDAGNGCVRVLDGNRLLMEIIPRHDEKLTKPLGQGSDQREMTQKRRQEIARRFQPTDAPTGALIVLANYRRYKKEERERDPKQAIRLGLAGSRRVSQFMVPKGGYDNDLIPSTKGQHKTPYEMRTEQALRDLLRTLGYRHKPFYLKPFSMALPTEMDVLGFYVIQLNKGKQNKETIRLPLVVEAQAGDSHLCIKLPRLTGHPHSYPSLRDAAVALASLEEHYAEISLEAFFREALAERDPQRPALLMLPEQNLRRVFDELDDQYGGPRLSLNSILDGLPQVRVARLRKSSDLEAPFCVSATTMSRHQGLYEAEFPGVFYSLHNLNRMSGLEDRKLDRPRDSAATPSTLQIWINNLPVGEDPALWAALVHRLRLESSHTDIATVLPQPMHDALKLREYLRDAVTENNDADEEVEED